MTLKVKRTEIRDGGAVNFGTTVMGGAVIEPGTTLLPLSLVLKEMHLPPATYEGSPVQPVGGTRPSLASVSERRRDEPATSREAIRASKRSGGAAAAI